MKSVLFRPRRNLFSHLRSTVKQDHLNKCLLMHCHKSITDTLDTVCKEVCFCQRTMQRTFWEINLSRGMRWAWCTMTTLPLLPPPPPPPTTFHFLVFEYLLMKHFFQCLIYYIYMSHSESYHQYTVRIFTRLVEFVLFIVHEHYF